MTFRSLPSVRFLIALVSLLAGLLALAGSASASRSQESIFQDDRLLLADNPALQTNALNELQSLHVKTIHSVINWNAIAPAASSRTQPAFDPTNPAAYPASNWAPVDALVRGAKARGIGLILTIAGPAPVWASDCKPGSFDARRSASHPGVCRPNASKFGQFATAVAKRYNGSFNGGGGALPRVTRWSLWNEPNLDSWIYPQIVSIRGKHYSIGAQIYRNLVYAGGNAIKKNGHGSDQILLGETAPVGQGTVRTSPVTFLQTVFCLDSNGRKLKGGAAKNVGCKGRYKKLPVNGVAHHPYTKGATQNLLAGERASDITIAYIKRLKNVLRQGVRAHAITGGTAGKIYFTEFGVSSRPPAAAGKGVSLAKQADYINLFEYLAFLDGSVRGVSQFQLEDDSNLQTHTFQTGIKRNSSGNFAHKPSYAAYQVPLFVDSSGKVWGGVRGLRSGTATLLHNGKKFRNVSVRNGYFLIRVHGVGGSWQLTSGALKSRVAKAERVKIPRQ